MDTAKTITHLGLCAGYGGIELGLKRVIPTLRSVALCEIESFAVANLVSKMEAGLMDAAPIWTDLKTFPWESFRDRVDILTGGYPCQPFSAAGKRLGGEDPRHLWPHISRGISILQPRVCFFENVEGHITCGLHHVLCDLGRLGYRTTWGLFSASECGAPHQRKRVFILANINDSGLEGCLSTRVLDSFRREESSNGHFGSSSDNGSELANTDNSRGRENKQSTELWSGGIKQPSSDSGRIKSGEIEKGSTQSGEAMANTDSIGGTRSGDELGMSRETRQGRENIAPNCFVSTMWPSRPGEPQYGWEPPRVVNSASARQQAQRSEPNGEWGQGSTSESGQLADSNATGREDWSEQCGREYPPSGEGISSISGCGAVPEAGELADSHRIDRSAQTEGREHDRQAGSAGEELGDTESRQDNGREPGDMGTTPSQGGCSDHAADGAGEAVMADAIGGWRQQAGSECGSGEVAADSGCQEGSRYQQAVIPDDQGGNAAERQTQPPLGRNPDGTAGGMDYAELCVTCDNRTDELRLLGNGVVPATAERAFRTLMRELDTTQARR